MERRHSGTAVCVLAFVLLGAGPVGAVAQPSKLEFVELGPLKLKQLRPGTINIFPQIRILNGVVHRRFSITAASGTFEYKSADGLTDVLSGQIRNLHIDGYISFSGEDQIASMYVERKNQLTFVLLPAKYSLPSYGGGKIFLEQPRVWVGNDTTIDMLKHTGRIRFVSDGVTWKGIQVLTDAPKVSLAVDARNRLPKVGARFVFDLATARLALDEGAFQSTAIRSVAVTPLDSARDRVSLGTITGPLLLDVHNGTLSVAAATLGAQFATASVGTAGLAPVVAVGTLSLSGLRSVADWNADQVFLRELSARRASFAPAPGVRALPDAWQRGDLGNLLRALGVSDPKEIRALALKEAQDRLAGLGTDLAFAAVRRSLVEKVLQRALRDLRSVSVRSVTFGEQSIAVSATLGGSLPSILARVSMPVEVEFTLGVRDTTLVLRPVTRLLLLGAFTVTTTVTASLIDILRTRLVSIVENNDSGFLEIDIPIELTPAVNVDLAPLSTAELKIQSPPFQLPLALRPVIVISTEALWVLSAVGIK